MIFREETADTSIEKIVFRAALVIITVLAMTVLMNANEVCSAAALPECEYVPGTNIGDNEYPWHHGSTVKSYLTVSNGGYMKVQGGVSGMAAAVAYYDSDYNILSRKTVAEELPIFGGFYESSSNYFLVTGQDNTEENNSKQVFRITKYDKNWNRLGSCGLNGANTVHPFDAGSCRMAMSGKYLLISTCHEMYTSSDGLNHQANVMIEVDTSTMRVTDSRTSVSNISTGYVSHSFNQFIRLENKHIAAIDHGDAYPRSIVLTVYPTDVTSGKFGSTNVADVNIMRFPGAIGDNATGATVGAFEISNTSYLVAGSSVVQDSQNTSHKTRNVFVAAVNRTNHSVSTKWMTSFTEGENSAGNPHMVRISGTKYMVIWARGDMFYYTYIDGNGSRISEIYEKKGKLSDCAPVIINNAVTWYTWTNHDETLYRIPLDNPENMTTKSVYFDHEPEIMSVSDGIATFKCRKCGEISTGRVPTSFKVFWRNAKTEGYTYSQPITDMIEEGDSAEYMINIDYEAGTGKIYDEFIIQSSDSENCIINKEKEQIRFLKAGIYNITFYPKYNPSLKHIETIKVVKELESLSLTVSASDVIFDEWVDITAVPEGGRGYLSYTYTAKAPDGTNMTIYENSSDSASWAPPYVGTWEITARVRDRYDEKEAVSNTVTVKVSPAEVIPKNGMVVSAYDLESGQPVSAIELYNDYFVNKKTEIPVDGMVVFDEPNKVLPVGTHTVGYTFKPEKSGYLEYKGIVTVSVVDNNSQYDDNDDYWSGDEGNDDSGYWDDEGYWHFYPEDDDSSDSDARYNQMGTDGTAFGRDASVEAAEDAMYYMSSDKDPSGTRFAPLKLKSTKQSKKSIRLTWKSVPGAKKYIVYANQCGRYRTLTKLKTLGSSARSYTTKKAGWSKLWKGTYYKFLVIAADGNNNVVSSSKIIHVATAGGKVGNHKKVTVKRSVIKKAKKLKVGKTLKFKARAAAASKKRKIKKHVALRYESSNSRIASVNRKGVVKALRKGKAVIYIYSQNGVSKAVKVVVK